MLPFKPLRKTSAEVKRLWQPLQHLPPRAKLLAAQLVSNRKNSVSDVSRGASWRQGTWRCERRSVRNAERCREPDPSHCATLGPLFLRCCFFSKGEQSNFPRKGLDRRSDRRNLSPSPPDHLSPWLSCEGRRRGQEPV